MIKLNTALKKIEPYYPFFVIGFAVIYGIIYGLFLYFPSPDEWQYLHETIVISEYLKNWEWFGNAQVGTHGSLFKIPPAIIMIFTKPTIYIPYFYHVLLICFNVIVFYKVALILFNSKGWSFVATFYFIASSLMLQGSFRYLRETPSILILTVLFYTILTKKHSLIIGIVLLILLEAKEYIGIMGIGGVLLYYSYNYLKEMKTIFSLKSIGVYLIRSAATVIPSFIFLFLMYYTGFIPENKHISLIFGLNFNHLNQNIIINPSSSAYSLDKRFRKYANPVRSKNNFKSTKRFVDIVDYIHFKNNTDNDIDYSKLKYDFSKYEEDINSNVDNAFIFDNDKENNIQIKKGKNNLISKKRNLISIIKVNQKLELAYNYTPPPKPTSNKEESQASATPPTSNKEESQASAAPPTSNKEESQASAAPPTSNKEESQASAAPPTSNKEESQASAAPPTSNKEESQASATPPTSNKEESKALPIKETFVVDYIDDEKKTKKIENNKNNKEIKKNSKIVNNDGYITKTIKYKGIKENTKDKVKINRDYGTDNNINRMDYLGLIQDITLQVSYIIVLIVNRVFTESTFNYASVPIYIIIISLISIMNIIISGRSNWSLILIFFFVFLAFFLLRTHQSRYLHPNILPIALLFIYFAKNVIYKKKHLLLFIIISIPASIFQLIYAGFAFTFLPSLFVQFVLIVLFLVKRPEIKKIVIGVFIFFTISFSIIYVVRSWMNVENEIGIDNYEEKMRKYSSYFDLNNNVYFLHSLTNPRFYFEGIKFYNRDINTGALFYRAHYDYLDPKFPKFYYIDYYKPNIFDFQYYGLKSQFSWYGILLRPFNDKWKMNINKVAFVVSKNFEYLKFEFKYSNNNQSILLDQFDSDISSKIRYWERATYYKDILYKTKPDWLILEEVHELWDNQELRIYGIDNKYRKIEN